MNIPQPRFLLRDPKSTKPTLINCHLRFNNERIVFSTGEKIIPIEWDSSKQRAINSKKYPHNSELNIWLDKVEMEVKTIFRTFNLDNISPTPDKIREQINNKLFNKASKKRPSLLAFIASYIEECSKIKNPNTVRTYITTYKHLQSYAQALKVYIPVENRTIFQLKTIPFLDAYLHSFCTNERRIKDDQNEYEAEDYSVQVPGRLYGAQDST